MTPLSSYRVADLPQNSPTPFDLTPDAPARATLADQLDIQAIRKLRFQGEIRAQGKRDWRLDGTLGATVVQTCVVTLEPVSTRIDVPVSRVYVTGLETPEGDEVEMPEDDTIEPLGDVIDPQAVMAEALSLALPLYPRKETATLETTVFTEPGATAMTDEAAKPFAGLADLRDAMKKQD